MKCFSSAGNVSNFCLCSNVNSSNKFSPVIKIPSHWNKYVQVTTVEILQLIIQLYMSYPILTILNNIVVEGNGIWKIVIMELSGSNWMK